MNKLLKQAIAEVIGTFVLVFCACGVAVWTCAQGIVGVVPTALAFGLVIVAMAYSIGRISGCHINPAVSLGCLLTKRMSVKEFFVYIAAQLVGAIVGGIALFGIVKMAGADFSTTFGNACNGIVGDNGAGSYIAAILVEVILTCIFVYVILNVTDSKNEGAGKKAGLIIGLTLTLVHLVGIGFTGTSVNPARSIGTALAALIFNGQTGPISVVWVFVVAPLIGGALAAVLFNALHKEAAAE